MRLVIDADAHANEPDDLFDRYLEKEFKEHGPKVVSIGKVQYWMVEGKLFPRPVGNWGHGTPNGYLFKKGKPDMAINAPGLDDVEGRLKDLDKEGIDIQVAYPNIMAMASHLDNGDLAAAMCRAYNNYTAEKSKAFNGRVRGIAAVPLQKPEEAAKELRRAIKDLGLVGTVVTGTVGSRNLDDPYFDPFFREANELGVAVGVHWITGCFDSPGQERFKDPYFYIHMVGMPFNLMIGIMTLIGGGIMEKYPRIKFVFLEIGAAWLPYWMWRMDDHYSRSMHQPAGVPKKPSDYVKSESCFVSCEPDEDGLAHTTEVIGTERIVFASDYPHGDCDFPHSVVKFRRRTDISEEIKGRILWDNAARLYGIS
jgi:predicted TIM-barrel fold metal-dependent hydrolase